MQDEFPDVELLGHRVYAFLTQRLYNLHSSINMFGGVLFPPNLTSIELYQTSIQMEFLYKMFHSFISCLGRAPDYTNCAINGVPDPGLHFGGSRLWMTKAS